MPETTEAEPRASWGVPVREAVPADTGGEPMPLVLMISSAFPPTGGAGVQRSAKFAKYLPRFGWRPVVWSASRLSRLPYDESLLADLPSDLIHYRSGRVGYVTPRDGLTGVPSKLNAGSRWRDRILPGVDWRLARGFAWLRSLLIPDDHVVWALRSLPRALRIIRKERIEVLYSTYSPASNHLLAGWLKRLTGLPWVSDYRDLWIDDYCYPPHGRVRRGIERRWQQSMLERADAVIAVHQEQSDVLASHVPTQKDKFFVVSNGVDMDDFDRVNRPGAGERLHGPADQFVLTFAGQFTSRRASADLFEALGRFTDWVVQRDGRFELRVVGVMSEEVCERLTSHGVPLKATGYLPHTEAIEQMLSADALLSVMPTGPNVSTVTPGKVYEYLASGRPILAIGPENGVTRQLVDRCRAGICIPPGRDNVLAALKQLWRDWKGGRLQEGCPPERLEPYTRQHLTGELAKILSHVRPAKARTAARPSP